VLQTEIYENEPLKSTGQYRTQSFTEAGEECNVADMNEEKRIIVVEKRKYLSPAQILKTAAERQEQREREAMRDKTYSEY